MDKREHSDTCGISTGFHSRCTCGAEGLERFVDNLHVPLTADDFLRLDDMSNDTGIPAKTIARVAIRETLAAYALAQAARDERGKGL